MEYATLVNSIIYFCVIVLFLVWLILSLKVICYFSYTLEKEGLELLAHLKR
jgi:hypothetical protein